MLIGEGQYNLDDLKEINVTESYLGMDQDVKNCQNKEPFYDCTTRQYINNIVVKCGCLPLNIRQTNKVLSQYIVLI